MSPLSLNRSDPNAGGPSYRDGVPVTEPTDFGNDVTWPTPDPTHYGNPTPSSGSEQNVVDWSTPDPTQFGNKINS